MSVEETELPDCQEKVGLKRKLTGPPRLLLGKSKSKDKFEGKSQRRQRQAKSCDGTVENIDQENNDGKDNESSLITHHTPQKASDERETQPDAPRDTSGILLTLEESESKDENIESKIKITRSTSKTSIKRTFSSLLRCGKKKESDRTENKNKAQHNMSNSVCESKLSNAKNKDVPNGKSKKRVFFTVWPISKRSATSNVCLGRGCKEQGGVVCQEITAPKDLTFKKIYRIFPRRKKAPHIDQFECSAPSATQIELADQLNQSLPAVMDIPSIEKEENQKEEQEMQAESIPERFTFSADVSINIKSDHIDKEQEICPDRDVSMNKEDDEVLQTSGLLDSDVPLSCCSGCSFDSELPGTSSAHDLLVLNKESIENDVRCRPVITIEHAYSSEEESMNEAPQFDGLTMNGSWQHLNISSLSNNTLHPSDLNVSTELDHGRCNETLLIQTAISMVQAAIRGAVEQLTIEQQHNQISLDHA
ncbi:uncharacterized protein si:dkey-1h6.8 isoform X1 [Chanodichthys erythropterus]|uniref:uncharacterized protein si:dkey-1h6.8 isoform X1 n=1 Tax=Chanodichthys erythropterus TaxID=933992 RepID=UPI00351F02B6